MFMKNNALSDWQSLARLYTDPHNLSHEELYRACVALSFVGENYQAYSVHLSDCSQALLKVRELIFQNKVSAAQQLLQELALAAKQEGLGADWAFLFGMICFKNNDAATAIAAFRESSLGYAQNSDWARSLKAKINALSAQESTIVSKTPEFLALEMEARRVDQWENLASLERTRAMEQLQQGEFGPALGSLSRALEHALKESSPEDTDIIQILLELLADSSGENHRNYTKGRSLAVVGSQKVAPYREIQTALNKGLAPRNLNHPILKRIPWEQMIFKPELSTRESSKAVPKQLSKGKNVLPLRSHSVAGKIIRSLEVAPREKYDLIEMVWGKGSVEEAYENRLYSALSWLRKKGYPVIFDGEKYRVAQ